MTAVLLLMSPTRILSTYQRHFFGTAYGGINGAKVVDGWSRVFVCRGDCNPGYGAARTCSAANNGIASTKSD